MLIVGTDFSLLVAKRRRQVTPCGTAGSAVFDFVSASVACARSQQWMPTECQFLHNTSDESGVSVRCDQYRETKEHHENAELLAAACFAFLGIFFAACSTPTTRIRTNPEVFDRLSPQQQQLVKAGQIGLGFEMDAVKLALGEPDRVTVRNDADGETVIWRYLSYESSGRVLFTGHYHAHHGLWASRILTIWIFQSDLSEIVS
jgi:hypothetical protein